LENERQGWRVGRIAIIAFWVLSLFVAVFLTRIFLNLFFTGPNNQIVPNWAGYSVASDFADPQPVIVGINGSWTVPKVSVSQRNVFSAVWIGIGGQFDNTLIQTGTEQDSNHGNVMYSAWYELLPNDSVTITTINVSSGDEITASISLINSTTNMWSIEIADATKQSFQTNVVYNSSRLSAEWIVERPTLNYQTRLLGTLADFGSLTFTNSRIRTDTSTGTIGDFPFLRFIMQNSPNKPLVTVSSLNSNGSSFTVTYLSGAGTTQSIMNEVLGDKIVLASKKHILIRVSFSFYIQRRALAFS
jgi:hypothetical protein